MMQMERSMKISSLFAMLFRSIPAVILASLLAGCGSMYTAERHEYPLLPPGVDRCGYERKALVARRHAVSEEAGQKPGYRGPEIAVPAAEPAPRGPACIMTPASSALSPASTSNFTVSVWFRCDQLPSASQEYAGLVAKYAAGNPSVSEWLVGIDCEGMLFLESTGEGTAVRVSSSARVGTGVWHFACGEWRQDGTASLFVNDRQAVSKVLARPKIGNLPVTVGDIYPADGVHGFNGIVDEIRIWRCPASVQFTAELFAQKPSADSDSDSVLDCDDPDDNNDGIPDDWAYRHFQDRLGGSPDEDPDHDRLGNMAEYVAGTDPLDSMSTFRIGNGVIAQTGAVNGSKGGRLLCNGLRGRVYGLSYTTNLFGSDWQAVGTPIECMANGPVSLDVPPLTNDIRRFYRVTVRLK